MGRVVLLWTQLVHLFTFDHLKSKPLPIIYVSLIISLLLAIRMGCFTLSVLRIIANPLYSVAMDHLRTVTDSIPPLEGSLCG